MKDVVQRSSDFMGRHAWVVAVALALAVRGPCLFCGFVYDDVPLIVHNQGISDPAFLSAAWSRDYGMEYAGEGKGFYRPLFLSLVWAIRRVFGPEPFAFHLFCLSFFCVTVFVLYRLVFLLTGGCVWLAALAGMFYASHPARVETVSIVTAFPDLVVEAVCLGLLLMAVGKWRISFMATVGGAAVLAVAAALFKESALFVLPALAVAAGASSVRASGEDRRRLLACAGGILIGFAGGVAARLNAGVSSPVSVHAVLSSMLGDRAYWSLRTVLLGTRDLFVPGPVVFWKDVAVPASGAWGFMPALAVAVGSAVWASALARGRTAESMAIAWICAVAVSLMMLAAAGYPYSQRYLAVAPVAVLLFSGIGRVRSQAALAFGTVGRRAGMLAVVLVSMCLSANTAFSIAGTVTCSAPLIFFESMCRSNPGEVVPVGAVAQTLNDAGAPSADVERRVRLATAIDPGDVQVPRLHNMMLRRYMEDGDFEGALRFADWSSGLYPADPDKAGFRAAALANLGRLAEALAEIDGFAEKFPGRGDFSTLREQILSGIDRLAPEKTVPE